MKARLAALILFGVSFAFVEAAVVFYLRKLLGLQLNYPMSDIKTFLNLGFIAFINANDSLLGGARITNLELFREFFTIVMLGSIAYLAGKTLRQKLSSFLIAFSVWDIFYYIFLKIIAGWPNSLLDIDVYFLIPVTWVGPVITPIIISTTLFILGLRLYIKNESS